MTCSRGSFIVSPLVLLILLSACGGSATPPATAGEAAAPEGSAVPAPTSSQTEAAPAPAASTETPASGDASGASAATAEHKESAGPTAEGGAEPGTGRNVRYMVSPDGMRVELEGLSLTPKAEAVKSGAGYGIKLRVDARAKDDEAHLILAPKGSEIALAGSVRRAGQSEPEKFGDERKGDEQVTVKGNKSVSITRSWPSAGGPKPLAPGDEAEFMVGLWGVGSDPSALRPLKKFCKITLKLDKGKPRVVLGPPDGVGR